jgi:hypothetical protein
MESLNLNQLIERLQHLHLEQEWILRALENIAGEDNIELTAADGIEPVIDTEDDIEPVAAVIASAIQHNEGDTTTAPAPIAVPMVTMFHIGQRVYITNRINHVLVRHATEADRTAIVTHFTASRVTIRTINGYHTHRHPKNLHPL